MPSSSRTLEGPPPSFSDTPPSTRPSSSASSASSGLPTAPSRTLSMDSLSTTPAGGGAPEKVEHIPTRTVGTGPKVNTNAMIFVKTGPAKLYVSATEQMKKAENIKNMRKKVVHEEEEPEWQQSSSSSSSSAAQDDWQSNLDKWKQKRNRNNKDVLERVLEVKKGIVESQQNARPKRSSKVGLRNLVVHDDDNDDLSEFGLGLNSSSTTTTNTNNTDDHTSHNNSRNEPNRATKITTSTTTSSNRIQSSTPSLSSPPSSLTADGGGGGGTGIHAKDILLDHDNKDAKSDAGFCTGSDTGSDGVFPEDNISDTSSALGDKKEPHDSLLDAAVPSSSSKDEDLRSSSSAADGPTSGPDAKDHEYTFDKAIEGYKQYAENSFKKRTSSMTSLTSVSSSSSRLEDRSKYDSSLSVSAAAAAAAKSVKIEDKLDFFKKEMDKEYSKPPPKPIVVMREKSPKIDVTKRKSMFEAGQSISTMNLTNIDSTSNSNLDKRRSQDMTASTGNLRNKLASFENVDTDAKKQKGVVVPLRDTKFKEKLANFSAKSIDEISAPNNRKKTPEKDKNFHQKLASFSKIQNGSTADESKNYDRRSSIPAQLNNTASLKSKIASFEQLDQHDPTTDFRLSDSGSKTREKSVSMECLSRSSATTRRLESRFSRGSVDRLDEEPSTESPPSSWGRSSSSHQPRSPEKTSYESRFSSETRSYQSRSPEKRPFVAPCTASSVQERRSQLDKKSVETVVTKSSEVSRSSRVSESQQSFSKTFEESPTPRTAYSGATPPLGSNGSPPEVPPLDLSHSQTEAPIGTSSPRTDSNSSSSQRTGVEVSTSSSSFSSSVAKTSSSSFSTTTSSSKISRSFAVDDDEVHYDDVLNTAEQPSLASSTEGDRLRYTDDDINEVILEAENSSRPRGAAPSPTPRNKDVVETKTSFSSSQSSSKVAEAPLSPPPAVPSVAPSLKSSPAFAFKSSPVLAPLPVTPVVFEDWADDHGGSVAPPSEPPPPPPPDSSDAEDSDAAPSSPSPARVGGGAPLSQDTLQRGGSPTPSDCPSLPLSEAYASSDTSSKTSAKEELRKRRSDFLGTSRFSDDVSSPPPDLDVLLRQQREADKKMLEARKALTQSSHQVMSNIDSRHQALSAANSMDSTAGARDRYTWQDRLRADSSGPTAALDDTDDGYDYQNVTSTSKTSTSETSTIVTSTSETSAIVTSSSETSSAKTNTSETSVANTSTPDTKVPSSDTLENTALLGTVTSDEATPDNGPTASQTSGCVTLDSKQTLTSDSPSDAPSGAPLDAPSGASLDAPSGASLDAPSDAPSDAIKGTYTVLDSFPTDKLPESSSAVPSSQPPAAGADVPTEQPKKLAELEAEMLRHDRSVMSRSRTQQQSSTVTPSAPYGGDLPPATDPADPATVTYDDVLAPTDSYNYQDGGDVTRQQTTLDTSVTSCSTDDYYEQHRQSQLKQQFFQQQQQHQQQQQQHQQQQQQVTEATYQNEEFYQQRIQQQQQQQQMVGDLAYSGADYYQQHRDQQQQQQQQYPVETGPEKPLRTYNPCYDSSAPAPEPLPRKMKPPPPPEEDRYESVSSSSSAQQQQFLTKQSRNALSATPRSRITDGESWIKRKPEANRDYNKHWLYQEAEQRRLEQRDTRNSQKKDQKVPQQPPQHHQQQLNNHPSAQYTASSSSYSSNMSRVESRSSDALQRSSSSDFGGLNRALDPHGRTASVDHALNRGPPVPEPHPSLRPQQEAPVNRNTDPNAWRNRAMTYQPLPPGGSAPHVSGSTDKPLPDAIINTLTQRVNNKSRPGSASNSSGRPSPYSTGTSTSGYGTIGYSNDENYHDYMNADAISNMQQQQQQQQQQSSHYQQTYSSAEPANHQQLYSSNSYSSSQQTFNNNNNNNTNGNHEHFAQHLQVSPTASLPLSSSSSTLSSQQQQHYSKPQHSYPNNNTTHQSPQSSPPSAKVAPTSSTQNSLEERQRLLSVSGKKKCSHCHKELGRGAAMIIESLRLYYHIPCFVCCVCGVQLSNGKKGADVNVRNHGVHCRNCYSNDQGVKFSEV